MIDGRFKSEVSPEKQETNNSERSLSHRSARQFLVAPNSCAVLHHFLCLFACVFFYT